MNDQLYYALTDKVLDIPGAFVLVDGQFGSTGKGLVAAALGKRFGDRCDVCTTNAGPNSGHTFYDRFNHKMVLKQIPSFAASTEDWYAPGHKMMTYLNSGAVINPDVLVSDVHTCGIIPRVDPFAAVIDNDAVGNDTVTVKRIASTGQGVGPALAYKVGRNPDAVMEGVSSRIKMDLTKFKVDRPNIDFHADRIFVEVAQGFSLGINSGFYPYTTSRECTVQQAIVDARIPASKVKDVCMTVRTYPIRVGNTENSSGPPYEDQAEIDWEDIGVEPEYTTVTGRKRRIFTWSNIQFREAVRINEPNIIFVNFLNYLKDEEEQITFTDNLIYQYKLVMRKSPDLVLGGFGPKDEDIEVLS